MEVMEEQIYNEGGTVLGVVDVLDRSTGLEDRQTTTPSVWEQAGLERNMTEVQMGIMNSGQLEDDKIDISNPCGNVSNSGVLKDEGNNDTTE